MATHTATDASFDADVLKSETPVLVDFWAEWCGPCKQLTPSLEAISEEMADKVKVVKVNIDENPNTPGQYGVRAIPTLMLFKNGQLVDTSTGVKPKGALVDWVNNQV